MDGTPIEIEAERAGPLLEVVRAGLALLGRTPARRRVDAWIREGRVLLQGVVAEDPKALVARGATLRVTPGAPGWRRGTGRAPPPAPGDFVHLDRHLLVVDLARPRGTAAAVQAHLGATLRAAGVKDLGAVPVPPACGAASGLTLAALSRAAGQGLVRAFEAGTASGEVDLLLVEEPSALVERVRVCGAVRGVTWGTAPLPASGIPASWVRAARHVHVKRLVLRHPATGRRLVFAAPLPAPFQEALEAVGIPATT